MVKKKTVETDDPNAETEVIPEQPESPTPIPEPTEPIKTTVETQDSLSEKLVQIYNNAESGTKWTLKDLAAQSGATERAVAQTWHVLRDEKKVSELGFAKP